MTANGFLSTVTGVTSCGIEPGAGRYNCINEASSEGAQFKFSLRPSQGFWKTGEPGYLFQGNKGLKMRGTKAILGNRET